MTKIEAQNEIARLTSEIAKVEKKFTPRTSRRTGFVLRAQLRELETKKIKMQFALVAGEYR